MTHETLFGILYILVGFLLFRVLIFTLEAQEEMADEINDFAIEEGCDICPIIITASVFCSFCCLLWPLWAPRKLLAKKKK